MAKGAMGVDPKKTKPKSPEELGLSRVSPGVYRDKYGNLTNSSGKVTRYASNNKDKRSIANPNPSKPTTVAPVNTQPTQDVGTTQPQQIDGGTGGGVNTTPEITPENIGKDLYGDAGDFYNRNLPENMGNFIQPQFTQQMQQAGNAIYDEFSRRAEPEFQRQIAAKEQELFERGIDPSNENYKLQMDQLMQQQNDARQSMRNQATQQGMGYQQQLFGQGQTIYGMPANIATSMGQPYMAQMQANIAEQQAARDRAFQEKMAATGFERGKEMSAIEFANQMQQLRAQGNINTRIAQIQSRRSGSGGGPANPNAASENALLAEILGRYGISDTAKPNYGNEAIGAATTAAGANLINSLNSSKKS